jgi:RNA polymerase sigma factor for flagellar operon FliA
MSIDAYQDVQSIGTEVLPITQYLAMVRRIAVHLRPRIPAYIELDDMIQLGTLGLMEAEKSFDPGQGVSFENYAKARIRGAIIDEARRLSDVSRLAIRNSKLHTEYSARLANSLGRQPTHREVAEALGIDVATYEEQRLHATQLNMLELDALLEEDGFDIASESHEAYATVAQSDVKSVIETAIAQLDTRKQLILQLYYVEEMTLKEIGAVIGVNESRISQILSGTLKELKPLLSSHYQSGALD